MRFYFPFVVIFLYLPPLVADGIPGQKNYESNCKSCHGKAGDGNPMFAKALKVDPALLDLTELEKSDVETVTLIKNGKGKMPAFKTRFSNDQIKDLVMYIRGFSEKSSQ